MSIWHKATDKPIEHSEVCVFDRHWKTSGWLSITMFFGEVLYSKNKRFPELWEVYNNDYRGQGCEIWYPKYEAEFVDDNVFDYWAYTRDLPELPK